jgi:hypothetical protein
LSQRGHQLQPAAPTERPGVEKKSGAGLRNRSSRESDSVDQPRDERTEIGLSASCKICEDRWTLPQGVMEDNFHRRCASQDDDPTDQPAAQACQYSLTKAARSISGDQASKSRECHCAADEDPAYRAIRLQVIRSEVPEQDHRHPCDAYQQAKDPDQASQYHGAFYQGSCRFGGPGCLPGLRSDGLAPDAANPPFAWFRNDLNG